MRPEPRQREAIVETIRAYDLDPTVYLFGSRVDDGARRGDIDLLVISQRLTREQLIDAKLDLYDRLGEQKIDLLVTDTPRTAIERIAPKGGRSAVTRHEASDLLGDLQKDMRQMACWLRRSLDKCGQLPLDGDLTDE